MDIKYGNNVYKLEELTKKELIDIVKDLYTEVLKLRDQKSLNSKNSSKSPSTDVNKPAPKSLRGKSNNKPGGQKGHEGSTLQQFENPDEVKEHKIVVCEHCEGSLDGVDITDQIIRQEIDIVPAKIIIREHRGDVKINGTKLSIKRLHEAA